jgi:hypothetical protein
MQQGFFVEAGKAFLLISTHDFIRPFYGFVMRVFQLVELICPCLLQFVYTCKS